MSNDKIAKGRHILQMKIASAKHLENPNSDLLKIPLEALHKIALQQIGEQEAYIEELEGQLKEFTEAAVLSRKDSVRIAEEVRREEVIAVSGKGSTSPSRRTADCARSTTSWLSSTHTA